MSARPPRGMRQSTSPRWRMNSVAASREVSSTSTTESWGRPLADIASRRTAAIAMLEWTAVDEPRRNAALPDFTHSPAASEVTLGRLS